MVKLGLLTRFVLPCPLVMLRLWESELRWSKIVLTEADKELAICVGAVMVGVFSNDPWVDDMANPFAPKSVTCSK